MLKNTIRKPTSGLLLEEYRCLVISVQRNKQNVFSWQIVQICLFLISNNNQGEIVNNLIRL